jgi:predicted RNA binding protein YcfA (HicA-like mRNA interferase family)
MSSYLPALTPKKVIQVLERIGFTFYRQKGSHRIYVYEDKQVVVPYHNKDLKKGTLLNIIKGTGLTVEEFKGYLP